MDRLHPKFRAYPSRILLPSPYSIRISYIAIACNKIPVLTPVSEQPIVVGATCTSGCSLTGRRTVAVTAKGHGALYTIRTLVGNRALVPVPEALLYRKTNRY
jgi:hypothetical protein